MNPNPNMSDVERDLLDALQPDTFKAGSSEPWQPGTLDEVDWCAQKAAEADAEYQAAVAAAQRQQEKIQAWLADAKTRRDDRVGFFEMHAANYLARLRADEAERGVKPEKLTKTLKLPSGGKVQARQQPEKVTVLDEEAALAWAEANAAQLVRVKKSLALAEVKKHIKGTGELPAGIELEPGDIKLSLSLPEVAS